MKKTDVTMYMLLDTLRGSEGLANRSSRAQVIEFRAGMIHQTRRKVCLDSQGFLDVCSYDFVSVDLNTVAVSSSVSSETVMI